MIDIIIVIVLLAVVSSAIVYIVKEKKKGVRCVGCPSGGTCSLTSCAGNCTCNGGGSAEQ